MKNETAAQVSKRISPVLAAHWEDMEILASTDRMMTTLHSLLLDVYETAYKHGLDSGARLTVEAIKRRMDEP